MATYPLTFPTQAPMDESIRLDWSQAVMESPWTFAQQTVNNSAHWVLEFTWPRVDHQLADRLQGWLDSLKGQVGTFRYRPRDHINSSLTGKTLAANAFAYAETVSIGGWTAGQASLLNIGQYLQIGNRLHKVVSAPANANGSGNCLVEIQPAIRATQIAGTAVNFQTPSGEFRLSTSDGFAYRLDPDRIPSFPTILAKEAL